MKQEVSHFNNGQTGESGGGLRETKRHIFVEVGVIDTVSVLRYIPTIKVRRFADLLESMIAEPFNLHVVPMKCA